MSSFAFTSLAFSLASPNLSESVAVPSASSVEPSASVVDPSANSPDFEASVVVPSFNVDVPFTNSFKPETSC